MILFEKPDWKCVFTYVQTFFRRFRNGRDPPVPTKKLTLTPPHISAPTPTINFAKSIEVSTCSSIIAAATISASSASETETSKTETKSETVKKQICQRASL